MASLSCNSCNFTALTELQLRSHMFHVHKDLTGALFCQKCQRACFSQRGLELHVSKFCTHRPENSTGEAGDPGLFSLYLKCCSTCKYNLEKKPVWKPTKNGAFYCQTMFLCGDCMKINQGNHHNTTLHTAFNN